MDRAERARLTTNRERVFALVSDGLWHDAVELMRIGGMRAVGRLHELKADGWEYEKRKKSGCLGVYEYRLLRKQAPEQMSLMEAR